MPLLAGVSYRRLIGDRSCLTGTGQEPADLTVVPDLTCVGLKDLCVTESSEGVEALVTGDIRLGLEPGQDSTSCRAALGLHGVANIGLHEVTEESSNGLIYTGLSDFFGTACNCAQTFGGDNDTAVRDVEVSRASESHSLSWGEPTWGLGAVGERREEREVLRRGHFDSGGDWL